MAVAIAAIAQLCSGATAPAPATTMVALKLRPFCLLCYDGAYVQSLALRGLGYPRTLIFTNVGAEDPNFDKIALALLSLTTFCCRSL